MLKSMQEVLEYGFEVLNEVYFDNALPPVVITIMSSPKTYGHFTVGKVWKAEENHLNEINISAEHLDRKIENVMATLQHELIHYFCQLCNIADTSQGGRYHNKNFKREAEARGLIISYAKYIGYSVTEPSPVLKIMKDIKAAINQAKKEIPHYKETLREGCPLHKFLFAYYATNKLSPFSFFNHPPH